MVATQISRRVSKHIEILYGNSELMTGNNSCAPTLTNGIPLEDKIMCEMKMGRQSCSRAGNIVVLPYSIKGGIRGVARAAAAQQRGARPYLPS